MFSGLAAGYRQTAINQRFLNRESGFYYPQKTAGGSPQMDGCRCLLLE
jgi:hypothetical protein